MASTKKVFTGVVTGTGEVRTFGTIGTQHIISVGSNPNPNDLRLVCSVDGDLYVIPLAQNSTGQPITHWDPSASCFVWSTLTATAFG